MMVMALTLAIATCPANCIDRLTCQDAILKWRAANETLKTENEQLRDDLATERKFDRPSSKWPWYLTFALGGFTAGLWASTR